MDNLTELGAEAVAAIERIGKLLALARDKRGNEAEAQNAMDAALKLLEKHNLDMALVERAKGQGTHAKRDDKTSGGGLYKWQRTIWQSVAKLNMCHYISLRGLEKGSKYENRLIGRPENVLSAKLMAEYLQDTVERLAAEWVRDEYPQGTSRFIKEAVIYREGMAARLDERLWWMRHEREEKAREQKAEAFKAAGGENALVVLTDVIQDEADLNNDYLRGLEPGTTKARRLERDAIYQKWRLENEQKQKAHEARMLVDPNYAAEWRLNQQIAENERKREEAKASRRTYSYRTRETEEDRRRSHSAFSRGYDRGKDIGLDQQVGKSDTKRIG
jgi:hypothetical protein